MAEDNKPAVAAKPRPAPREDRGDAPSPLGPVEVYTPAAAGTDPDSLERVAKQLESNPGDDSNDHADELRKRAADARKAARRDGVPEGRHSAQRSVS